MGSLLMQFEYQNALAKATLYERKAIRLNNLSERYQKRIGQIEQVFTKKKNQLDSKFERLSSRVSSQINQMAINGSFSLTGIAGISITDALATVISAALTADTATAAAVGAGKTEDGEDTAAAAQTSQLAQYNAKQSAFSQVASQLQIAIKEIIDAMKEAEEARLEELEDAQLDPITQKDIQVQGDAAMYEALTEMADQRAEKAKARLGEDIKKSTAGYGLA